MRLFKMDLKRRRRQGANISRCFTCSCTTSPRSFMQRGQRKPSLTSPSPAIPFLCKKWWPFNDRFCVCTITCMYYLAIHGHLRQNFNSKIPFLRPTFQFRQIIFELTEYNIDHIHYTNTYMCCPVMPHTRTK